MKELFIEIKGPTIWYNIVKLILQNTEELKNRISEKHKLINNIFSFTVDELEEDSWIRAVLFRLCISFYFSKIDVIFKMISNLFLWLIF